MKILNFKGDMSMCCMIRTFHPVGQGLFCSERFVKDNGDAVNIVYDCGSNSLCPRKIDVENSKLKRVIDDSFASNDEIEAIFISHYDLDHINGVYYLIKHWKVNKIFLPEFTSEEALVSHVLNDEAFEDLSVADESITMMQAYYNPEMLHDAGFQGEIVSVPLNDSDHRLADNPRMDNLSRALKEVEDRIDDAIDGFSGDRWRLVPFNNSSLKPKRRARFLEVVSEVLTASYGRTATSQEIDKFINDTVDEIRHNPLLKSDLLREINRVLKEKLDTKKNGRQFYSDFGTSNGSSMVLYSGPNSNKTYYGHIDYCGEWIINPYAMGCSCLDRRSGSRLLGCLYFGDYEADNRRNWGELRGFYEIMQKCWNLIGCVQLPHHGSKHNFNDEICNLDACSVACYGIGNSFGHPGFDVVEQLQEKGRLVYQVTEYSKCIGVSRVWYNRRELRSVPSLIARCYYCIIGAFHRKFYEYRSLCR